jgi:hypothetical protein
MKAVAFVLAALGGVLAGAILGVIVATIATALVASSSPGLDIVIQAVLALAVAFGIYRTLISKGLDVTLRVLFVAMGVGVLGALTVCTAILSSSNPHF